MKLNIAALLILLPFVSIGQNKIYLGFEIGPKFEIYQYVDNGNGLYTEPFVFSPIYGVTIGRELNQTLIFETGFYVNNYGKNYRIKGVWGFGASNAFLAYQIPLRLKARLNLFRDRLSIVPTIGYTLAINEDYGSSGSGYSSTGSSGLQYNDSTRIEDISTYNFEKTYGVIEMGVGLDYKLKNSWTLYLATNYLAGFSRIVEIDVKYWINDEPEQTGTVFSNGNYYNIVFGIKYPISNLWTKKPDKDKINNQEW